MRRLSVLISSSLLFAAAHVVAGIPQTAAAPPPQTVFYKSGKLNIEAYLYTPAGPGPFPLVIYNHGSRAGQERVEQPMLFIGRLFTAAGYAALVPERRGYGNSDGPTSSEEVGTDRGAKMIGRLQAEADDVLASLAYVNTLPAIDTTHIAIMGWSYGGITTIFAASRSHAFVAAINQAGGSLSWQGNSMLQHALPEAARAVTIPLLCLVAKNDATTAAVQAVYDAVKAKSAANLIIYPAFAPTTNPGNIAPGHLIFSAQGVELWKNDVLTFLAKHLTR